MCDKQNIIDNHFSRNAWNEKPIWKYSSSNNLKKNQTTFWSSYPLTIQETQNLNEIERNQLARNCTSLFYFLLMTANISSFRIKSMLYTSCIKQSFLVCRNEKKKKKIENLCMCVCVCDRENWTPYNLILRILFNWQKCHRKLSFPASVWYFLSLFYQLLSK